MGIAPKQRDPDSTGPLQPFSFHSTSEVVSVSFVDAVQSNDRRDALLALRDKIAATIDGTDSGRDIAALSKRLMEVMREIDALPDPGASEDPVEAMRRKRAK